MATWFSRAALSCARSVTVSWVLLACLACNSNDGSPPGRDGDKSTVGWQMYGYDLANSQNNPTESQITRSTVGRLGAAWHIQVGSGATSTPAVADGTVYFGGWDGFVYAADATSGELRWKTRAGKLFVRNTPLVTDDRVYMGVDGSLMAFSRHDGRKVFESLINDHPQALIESSPKLADGVIVIGIASYELNLSKSPYAFHGAVLGLDAEDGKVLWKLPVTGDQEPCKGGGGVSVWSTAAVDRELGLVYIGTGQTYEEPASTCNDSLLAIHYKADYQGARLAWKSTFTDNDVYVTVGGGLNGLDHDIGAAPNLFAVGSTPAVGVGDKGGSYRAFNRKTGAPLWSVNLDAGPLKQLGGVMTTAAVSSNTLFVASNRWLAFGFISTGTHAPEDTAIVYALDTATGETRWTQTVRAPVFGGLVLSGGLLYHASIDGTLYARDPATGAELWTTQVGAAIGCAPSLTADALYVSAGFTLGGDGGGGHVFGYRLDASETKVLDERETAYAERTADQCHAALKALQPDDACRSCLCECDASAAGNCSEACWDEAGCTVDKCGDGGFDSASGAGVAGCFTEQCSSKLLPPVIYTQSVRAASCVLLCKDTCKF